MIRWWCDSVTCIHKSVCTYDVSSPLNISPSAHLDCNASARWTLCFAYITKPAQTALCCSSLIWKPWFLISLQNLDPQFLLWQLVYGRYCVSLPFDDDLAYKATSNTTMWCLPILWDVWRTMTPMSRRRSMTMTYTLAVDGTESFPLIRSHQPARGGNDRHALASPPARAHI